MNRLRNRDNKGHVCDEACGITYDSDCPAWQSEASHLKTPKEVERQKQGERLAELLRRHGGELEPVLLELLATEIGWLVGQLAPKPRKRRAGR